MQLIYFIRSCLFAAGQILTMVIFSLLGQLTRPFSLKKRYQFMHYWAQFCIWWLKITCGIRFEVHGLEKVDVSKSSLVLSRHESAWETLAFQQIFPRQAYVLKRELLKIPFFGWGMKLLNPIAIDRSAGRKALNQLLKEGVERLHGDDWVVVFPEGTRMATNERGKINVGGSMLALKAKAPVYLVAHNAGKFWPKNGFIKRPGVVQVFISEPVDVESLSLAQLNEKVADWFSQTIDSPKDMTKNPSGIAKNTAAPHHSSPGSAK